ncbi:bifunctional UDP-sugar hydrolase/5'-nucleotidase UshA [Shewanella sp. SW36]|jgi:5'-nucleotidase/UDP-sugar diphosphatase|uniref:bifunctional UDP-sugar hydrolase/5'-nucleotidase UshA n=1 Tax=Shewanella TaxID=22 RepID=UPI000CF6D386|nr:MULTISPECIES: bifunctional UDP-sugar hydrolase/5'-nucleotidase UshA [Shewanella]RBP77536.1 5'-nucleotidase/UDP-sugar diphosphatase [Shewanella putrefaciens]GCF88182.1 bifunctional metallophosphatase/5'-nucleotidase [Shewanella sp. M-Br]AVI67502.1 bifunctional UDP-sugar hydrolase/5'-nucleotidase [Shewanella sp. WE21]MBI1676362.1 bifunctional UDP-sugar hydrolase/5'-nucleotidase [Shewanella sp. DW31]MCU7974955.1 bifunctional UDP-sugar hydrolase/5'-nucleotidase UshA [Shewanella sp. SW36]
MRHMLIKGLVATAVLAALAGCNNSDDDKVPTTCAEAGSACKTFTVLHTNDNHGRFWENSDGEYGLAAQKTLVDQIRAEVSKNGSQTLLLSGGDINTGVPESDLQDAIPDFTGMNKIGYDAMAVGNHEFDNPLSVLDMQRRLAEFPMLAANIYRKNADGTLGERYFDAYKVFDVNGLKVAVIGLTTEDTAKIGNPEYISDLTFTDPKVEVAKVIKEIKDAKAADIIFATTHMGHYADGKNGSNAPGDVAMARALKEGDLQVVIGGHSQNPVCMEPGTDNKAYAAFKPGDACAPDKQNGTWIMQAHEWGKYVGRADFEYFNGELHLASYKLVPVNMRKLDDAGKKTADLAGTKIEPDSELKELLSYYQEKGQAKLDEVIATTDALLDGERANVRNKQTNLGRMLAMAQSAKVTADFGVMNSGGVRASIQPGNISYRDVLTVQPFGNMVTLNEMTGTEVAAYLGAVGSLQVGSGGYAQITGVKMTIDCVAKTANISDIGGKDFSPTATYKFTVPSFNAAGGDGYPKLTSPIQTGFVDADLLYSFLKEKQVIKAADYNPVGDIVYENSKSVEGCQL